MANRKRIQRARKAPISDAAINAFRTWRKLNEECDCHARDCSICARRWDMHKTIRDELRLKPWQFVWENDPYIMGLLTRAARIAANDEVST